MGQKTQSSSCQISEIFVSNTQTYWHLLANSQNYISYSSTDISWAFSCQKVCVFLEAVTMCCPLVADLGWAATEETDGENLFTHNELIQEEWRESNPPRIQPPCSQCLRMIKTHSLLLKQKCIQNYFAATTKNCWQKWKLEIKNIYLSLYKALFIGHKASVSVSVFQTITHLIKLESGNNVQYVD